VAEVVASKCETLCSNPRTTKRKTKTKTNRENSFILMLSIWPENGRPINCLIKPLPNEDPFPVDGISCINPFFYSSLSFSKFLLSTPLLSAYSFFFFDCHQIQVVVSNLFCFPDSFEESYGPSFKKNVCI
jgi:hypothetical protein